MSEQHHTYVGTAHDHYERDGVPVTPPVRCYVGTEHRLKFELNGVPAADLPFSHQGLRYIPTAATVVVTVAGTEPPTVDRVMATGFRTSKNDDTPTRQKVTGDYTSILGGWPEFVQALATDALAIITRQDI